MEFWPFFFDIFHRLRPYLYSKRSVWGSFYKQTTQRRPSDEPYLYFGAHHTWLGMAQNGPFWTQNGQTWQACQRSKVVPKGPKGTKMVNRSVFDYLGPFWAYLDPFGPFQTKSYFLLRGTSSKPYFVHSGQKVHFCMKWFKRVQMGRPPDKLSYMYFCVLLIVGIHWQESIRLFSAYHHYPRVQLPLDQACSQFSLMPKFRQSSLEASQPPHHIWSFFFWSEWSLWSRLSSRSRWSSWSLNCSQSKSLSL